MGTDSETATTFYVSEGGKMLSWRDHEFDLFMYETTDYVKEDETETPVLKWRRAKAGRNFGKDTIVIPDNDPDPRLVRCAVYDCKYIHVEDLLKLPVDDG